VNDWVSRKVQLPILVAIITGHLDDFLAFSGFILRKDATKAKG
jgi:hypothetical protein